MEIKITDAGDVAKKRFYDYLDETLSKEEWDDTRWEFYTFLLEQAKNHKLHTSGYGPFEYQKDKDEAKRICQQRNIAEEQGGSFKN